nr:unnamed protein product [Callosobruchus chinensis]
MFLQETSIEIGELLKPVF